MPVIGFIGTSSPVFTEPYLAAFCQGLSEGGFVEGRNVMIKYRWAEGHFDRLPALAADLVDHKVDVIFTTGGSAGIRRQRARPRRSRSNLSRRRRPGRNRPCLARPGGNLTGISIMAQG